MFRRMQLTALWGVTSLLYLLVSIPLDAQILAMNQRLPLGNTPVSSSKPLLLNDVLNELKSHFQVDILFDSQITKGVTVPNFNINKHWKVEKNLDQVLSPLGLTYRKVNKSSYLILEKSKESERRTIDKRPANARLEDNAALPVQPADEQAVMAVPVQSREDFSVAGKVIDDAGAPLPGVSIMIKGTQQGTATNADGEYKLTVSKLPVSLVFSFVGYISKEVEINNQTNPIVRLSTDTKALE